jgi:hypothetical protein
MARITEAIALPGYRLHLRFDDGAEGDTNLSSLIGKGVFASWNDPAVFAKVSVDPLSGTVCWPGGIDLDPYVLHHEITGSPLPGEAPAPTR